MKEFRKQPKEKNQPKNYNPEQKIENKNVPEDKWNTNDRKDQKNRGGGCGC